MVKARTCGAGREAIWRHRRWGVCRWVTVIAAILAGRDSGRAAVAVSAPTWVSASAAKLVLRTADLAVVIAATWVAANCGHVGGVERRDLGGGERL